MNRQFNLSEKIFNHSQEQLNLINEELLSFEFKDEVVYLRGLSCFLPHEETKKSLTFFLRLKDFFEIGFLLDRDTKTNLWNAKHSFMFKKISSDSSSNNSSNNSSKSNTEKLLLKLPLVPLFTPFKSTNQHFLNSLSLSTLEKLDLNSILIKISENQAMILMTKQADPWLKSKLEIIIKELKNGLL